HEFLIALLQCIQSRFEDGDLACMRSLNAFECRGGQPPAQSTLQDEKLGAHGFNEGEKIPRNYPFLVEYDVVELQRRRAGALQSDERVMVSCDHAGRLCGYGDEDRAAIGAFCGDSDDKTVIYEVRRPSNAAV